jgi:hypothetical protein
VGRLWIGHVEWVDGRNWRTGTLVVLALLLRARCGLIDVLVGGSLGD